MRSIAAVLVLAMIWTVGLLAFAARVAASTPPREPAAADAAVALTGLGSAERIAAAVRLLEDGKAKRVLVSGVNREVSREDVRALGGAVQRLYDCCVDLGFTAATTLGNARETAEWAQAMRFSDIIVVTADYHMPRAMLELRATMPDARLTPYPVATSALDAQRWWRTGRGARLLTVEYCKYLAILGREAVLGLGPKDDPAPRKG